MEGEKRYNIALKKLPLTRDTSINSVLVCVCVVKVDSFSHEHDEHGAKHLPLAVKVVLRDIQ